MKSLNGKRTLLVVSAVLAALIALAGCQAAGAGGGDGGGGNGSGDGQETGAGDGGDNGGGDSDLVITGTTQYSDDNGSTTTDAPFRLTAAGVTTTAFSGETSVPASGVLKAGDVFLDVEGVYDTTNGTFTISASGTTSAGDTIDITVDGFYDPNTDSISNGQTVVRVQDNSGNTSFYQSTSVSSGDSATNPIDDTSGTETATPIPAEETKFWEGTWVDGLRRYVEADIATEAPEGSTPYYTEDAASISATTNQIIIRESTIFSLAAKERRLQIDPSDPLVDGVNYSFLTIVQVTEGSDPAWNGDYADIIFEEVGGSFFKQRLYQPTPTSVYFVDYSDGSGDEDSNFSRSTAADADNDLTELAFANAAAVTIDTVSGEPFERVQ
jgi:hypothetical protein